VICAAGNKSGVTRLEFPPVWGFIGQIDVGTAFQAINDLVAGMADDFTFLACMKIDNADRKHPGVADEAHSHWPCLADDLIEVVAGPGDGRALVSRAAAGV
jgi:hypothetical protein